MGTEDIDYKGYTLKIQSQGNGWKVSMRSSSVTGRRREIEVVDGLRFGKRTRSALLQST